MNRPATKAFLLALGLAVVAPLSASAQDEPDKPDVPKLTKADLQKLYADHLTEEGFRPKVDEDGDVTFKYEGGNYFIRVDENDPTFFQVNFPNFWPIESEEERKHAYMAASLVAMECKVAKVYVVEDDVWVSVELFFESPEQFKRVFGRAMHALQNGRDLFSSKMRELKEGEKGESDVNSGGADPNDHGR
jgi:hypothetical protein